MEEQENLEKTSPADDKCYRNYKDWKVEKLILEGTRTNTTINTFDDKDNEYVVTPLY